MREMGVEEWIMMPVQLVSEDLNEKLSRDRRRCEEKRWMHDDRTVLINDASTWNHGCRGKVSVQNRMHGDQCKKEKET
jgi:hypothetical protein